MRKIILIIIAILMSVIYVFALTPGEIIKKVDDNQIFTTIEYEGIMKIQKAKKRRKLNVKEFWVVAKGKKQAFIQFYEDGVKTDKYLRLGDEFWVKGVYAEEASKLEAHKMLMGSDFSYEDTMENEKLMDRYSVKLIGTERVEPYGDCYKIELNAKVKKVSYKRMLVWVSKDKFVNVKTRYFAISGELLKELKVLQTMEIKGRVFPAKIKMESKTHIGAYTVFEMKNIKLDEPVNESYFTMENLEK